MDLKTKCSKCGKSMDFSEMRALPEHKGYVCRECYKTPEERIPKGNSTSPTVSAPNPTSNPRVQSDKLNTEKSFFAKREFICDKCKYKFSRNADVKVEKCPYCSGTSFHERKEDSTDKLINDY